MNHKKGFTPAPKHRECGELDNKYNVLVRGFTLIELIMAIGIIGILAAATFISAKSYRISARASKMQALLSSTIPGMANCWSFASGDVRSPSSGDNICYLGSSAQQQTSASQYGQWPDLSQVGNDYYYGFDWENPPENSCSGGYCKISFLPNDESEKNYSSGNGFFVKKAQAMLAGPLCFASSSWFFAAKSDSDKVKVCCNSMMKGCKAIDYSAACNSSVN